LVSIPLLYLAAAVFLGLVPANVSFRQPADGVIIFVETNGIHTWIVMPKVNEDMDWRPLVLPAHLKDPRWGNADHVAIGYGNREFYLNTPTWGDLTVRRAAAAFFGNGPSLWRRPRVPSGFVTNARCEVRRQAHRSASS